MDILNSISQHAAEFLLFLALAVVVLAAVAVRQRMALQAIKSTWRTLFDGSRGENIERLLLDHLKERLALESNVAGIENRVTELETRMATAKRHLGAVRYDAFEDVGGAQSFALALYDDKGDGFVMNGIIGRADSRVYCKPIVGGRCDRNLSSEERRAIKEAFAEPERQVVSP